MAFNRLSHFLVRIKHKVLFVLLITLAPMTYASTPTVDGGALLQQLTPSIPLIKPPYVPEDEADAELAPAPEAPTRVQVKVMTIVDPDNLLTPEQKAELVADALGQTLDFAGLVFYRDRVTDALRAQGYLLARAYLPRQDISDGVIEIHLLMGSLDKTQPFELLNQTTEPTPQRADLDFLTAIASQSLTPGLALTEADLNEALLRMNDLAGIGVATTLTEGSELGTSRLVFSLEEAPLHQGLAWVDNQGNSGTGEGQVSGQYRLVNPRGRGDELSVLATKSRGVDLAFVNYSAPIHANGLSLTGGITALDYRVITQVGRDLGLTGRVQGANLGLRYPMLRSRQQSLFYSMQFNKQRMVDDADAGRIKTRNKHSLQLSLNGDWVDQRLGPVALNSWTASWTQGQLTQMPSDETTVAEGSFSKLNYSLNRTQNLQRNLTVYAAARGQFAMSDLDSSEQMSLGGANGVRAYPGSEASGDQAHVFTLELRAQLAQSGWFDMAQLTGFYDLGLVRLRQTGLETPLGNKYERNEYRLQALGVGLRLSKSDQLMLQATLAKKVGTNYGANVEGNDADGKRDPFRLWIQAVTWF